MESYGSAFRGILKEIRNSIREMINKNNIQMEMLSASSTIAIDSYTKTPEFRKSKIINTFISGNDEAIIKECQLPDELNDLLDETVNVIENLGIVNKLLNNLLRQIQNTINVYNDDKVTKEIDTSVLLILFEIIRINNMAKPEILAAAFGMNVCAAIKEFEKGNKDISHIDDLLFFSAYYNPDGSFKYNSDVLGYLERFTELCSKVNAEFSESTFVDEVNPVMAVEFVNVLIESNVWHSKKTMNAFDTMKVGYKSPVGANYDALAALKAYYRNGEIVKIPEDMDAFSELLKACKLDEKEQKFILSLIEKMLNEQNEDINLRVLQGTDLEIYHTAKGLLENLYYTDPDYYIVVEAFQNLTSISELLLDAPDDEYLLSQKDEIIAYLKEFNAKHLKVSELSTNNLVLLGDYFASDLEGLQVDKRPRVLDILSRINKDNQGRFRKIMTSENLSYVPYELIAKNVQVSFVELDTGIYAILGCAIDNSIFKNTINRIIKEETNLQIIEAGIKDPKRRNDILVNAEEELANLKGQSRK